jgi:hypothetical protein
MGVTAYLVVLVFQYDDEVLHPSKSQPNGFLWTAT